MPDSGELLAAKFEAIFPHLDERQRRLLMGAEARVLGHGGIRVVARAAVNASARPPTWSIRSPSVYAGHGVGRPSSSSPTRVTRSASRWAAGPRSTMLMVKGLPRSPGIIGHALPGTAPVPDGGDRLPLAEPGTVGERPIEPVRAKRLAALGHQLGLAPP